MMTDGIFDTLLSYKMNTFFKLELPKKHLMLAN